MDDQPKKTGKSTPAKRGDITLETIEKPFSSPGRTRIEIFRETVGGLSSLIMLGIFLMLILFPIFRPDSTGYIQNILPTVTTLLGASFAFYFSEKRLDEKR